MPGTPFETKALDDICLTVEDGEMLGIIGHTGSGKSTLITHMNGLIRPETGTVLVNGVDTREKSTLSSIRRHVGLVFQYPEYQLFEETVEKDVAFGPKNLKLSDDEVAQRVKDALDMVGFPEDAREKSPFELSGGQKRRVAIAGVLAMQPDVLILDEPAAGLDPAGRSDMLDLVKKIHDSGTTVVMVSHSMEDVGRLCGRLIVMNRGKIAFSGAPGEVFRHEAELKAMGLDIPQCAQLANRLRDGGIPVPEGAFLMEDVEKAILTHFGKDGKDA